MPVSEDGDVEAMALVMHHDVRIPDSSNLPSRLMSGLVKILRRTIGTDLARQILETVQRSQSHDFPCVPLLAC